MPLQNAERAVVDPRKLTDYSLNLSHKEGKHKARVFQQVLGLTLEDTDWLRESLEEAVRTYPAVFMSQNAFGRQYRIDFSVTRRGRTAMIRSGWIIMNGEDFPRLTTCFIRPRKGG